jgi:hypothetical protein
MSVDSYTVFRTPYAGWFKINFAAQTVEKIEKDDPRVIEALEKKVAILFGSDISAEARASDKAEIERLKKVLNDEKEKTVAAQVEIVNLGRKARHFDKMVKVCRNFQASAETSSKREADAIAQLDKAQAETRDAKAAAAVSERARVDAVRDLGIRTGDLTAARTRVTQLEAELGQEKAARAADATRATTTGGADPAEITRLNSEVIRLNGLLQTAERERDRLQTAANQPRPAAPPPSPPPAAPQKSFWRWAAPYAALIVFGVIVGGWLFGSVFKSTPPDVASVQAFLDDCKTQSATKDATIKERDATIVQKDEIIRTKIANASPPKQEPPKTEEKPKDDSRPAVDVPAAKGDVEKKLPPPPVLNTQVPPPPPSAPVASLLYPPPAATQVSTDPRCTLPGTTYIPSLRRCIR